MRPMNAADEYILGTDDLELQRLGEQHDAWRDEAFRAFERGGIGPGQTVLDLGCGPGSTSYDLARTVGAEGRVTALDLSGAFVRHLGRRIEADPPAAPIAPMQGSVEALDLPDASFDAAYARWVLCWLEDPAAAIREAARVLRPGGALVLQEYIEWGTMKMVPRVPEFDRVVEACLWSWKAGGVDIDIVERVPHFAAACGLEVESITPVARAGAVGSPVWNWLGGFYASYLPRMQTRPGAPEGVVDRWRAVWAQQEARGDVWLVAPTVADVVLRKPRG